VTGPTGDACVVWAAGHRIEIRRGRVLVDGTVRPLTSGEMTTLHALARVPGAVVSHSTLSRALTGDGGTAHAVETAVWRLRTALGDKNIVSTVVKRGYRLAIDHDPTPTARSSGRRDQCGQ